MPTPGYADILCPDFAFATGCVAPKAPGSLVHLGTNSGAVFEVVAIDGPTAWVREHGNGRNEALVPLARLRLANAALS